MNRTILAVVAMFSGLLGCSSPAEQASRDQDNAARERAFQFSGGDTLAQRASFDLSCAPQMMQATVLQRVGMFQIAVSAGVRGCGRQATYIRAPGTGGAWMLNGPVLQDSVGQPPPPPQQQPQFQPPPPPPPPPPPTGQ